MNQNIQQYDGYAVQTQPNGTPLFLVDVQKELEQSLKQQEIDLVNSLPKPPKVGWGDRFFGSRADNQFLNTYNNNNVMSYPQIGEAFKQGSLTGESLMDAINLRHRLDTLQADAEYRKARNTNIAKGAIDIGTSVIPLGGAGKLGGWGVNKMAPYLGSQVSQHVVNGMANGLKGGIIQGIGHSLLDDSINPFTESIKRGLSNMALGALSGYGFGRIHQGSGENIFH